MSNEPETYPSFRYGPDGVAQIFQSAAEVPKGWEDHPSKLKGTKEAPEKVSTTDEHGRRLGRAELISALKRRGIQFAPNAGGAELAMLLEASAPVTVDINGKADVTKGPEGTDPSQPGPNPLDPADGREGGLAEINDLRAAYQTKFEKRPFMGWDEATLREKLAE